jgi:hypothetical protein
VLESAATDPMLLVSLHIVDILDMGFGANLDYRISRRFGFDSEINLSPGSWRIRGESRTVEGLFGIRYGFRQQRWGVFAKLRPGFVYYDKARPELNSQLLGNLTRFAFDVGPSFEYYPSRRSTFRLDIGTTLRVNLL